MNSESVFTTSAQQPHNEPSIDNSDNGWIKMIVRAWKVTPIACSLVMIIYSLLPLMCLNK